MITKDDIHRMDLNYLLNAPRADMSLEAVTKRMEEMGRLCELSRKLGIPYIYKYVIGEEKILGLPPPVGETNS